MTRLAVLPWNRLAATILAAALLALLIVPAAPAQAPPEPASRHVAEGTDIFRKSLDLLHFKPLKSFPDLALDPSNSILIMLGDTHRLNEVPGGLQQFISRGGAALIASDLPMQPDASRALVDTTGVEVTGFQWAAPKDPRKARQAQKDSYREIDGCPFLEPFDADQPNRRLLQHPREDRLVRVATNLPSTLEGPRWPPRVRPFAVLPRTTEFLAPEDHPAPLFWLFGVAGDLDAGRIIVLADHSLFINEMMKPTDNDNVEFTANCLTYLRGDHNQRKRVLFVDNGVIHPSFEIGPKVPASELLGRLAQGVLGAANAKLNRAQDRLNELDRDDGLNQRTLHLLGRVFNSPRQLFTAVAILGTLFLLIYACYRVGIASVYKKEAALPSLARVVAQQGPPGTLLALRHEGQVSAANIAETGRQLARDAFEAGGVAAPVPYREPTVTVTGVGWWRRIGLRRRVLQLWRLAFHHQPAPLAPNAVRALVAELEQLKADLKRGTIQLT